MNRKKVLIVDDEENIVELIKFNLQKNGYDTIEAYNGNDALNCVNTEKTDILILDWMLPEVDGLEVCKRVKSMDKTISIIMLTAKDEEIDKILGLEIGADDYITKPFSVRELLARMKAVLRRNDISDISNGNNESENKVYECGKLKIDYDRHEVYYDKKIVTMTYKEYELLCVLVKNKGKILKREILLDSVWGYGYVGETRTVDVHVRYLRKKIEEDDSNPKLIETIRGVGYRFNQVE